MDSSINMLIETNFILAKQYKNIIELASNVIESNSVNEKHDEKNIDIEGECATTETISAKFSAKFINDVVIEMALLYPFQGYRFAEDGALFVGEGRDIRGCKYGFTITEIYENTYIVNAFYGERCLHFRGLECKGLKVNTGFRVHIDTITFAEIKCLSDALIETLGDKKLIVETNDIGCRIIGSHIC